MGFAHWVTKATDTHSECVIITASIPQKRLRERVSILLSAYSILPVFFLLSTTFESNYSELLAPPPLKE